MKRFFLPDGDKTHATVYSWTEGRFFVEYYDGPEHIVYMAKSEMVQLHPFPKLFSACHSSGLKADEGNLNFYSPCFCGWKNGVYFHSWKLPELISLEEPVPNLKAPFGGGEVVRLGNKALIAGKVRQCIVQKGLYELFLKDVEVHFSNIIILDFLANNSYRVNVMAIAKQWYGEVVSVAISLDGMTACAIIKYRGNIDTKWEVVIWDLE